MNSRAMTFYIDLLGEKIDLSYQAFSERVDAIRKGDFEKVEFIEKMALEPLDNQKAYLYQKVLSLTKEYENE